MSPLSCTVCTLEQSSVGVLHYHQMCLHTTEELSLALLSIRGLTNVNIDSCDESDTEPCSDEEGSLLRKALTKYPRFLAQSAIFVCHAVKLNPEIKQSNRPSKQLDKGIQTRETEDDNTNDESSPSKESELSRLLTQKRQPKKVVVYRSPASLFMSCAETDSSPESSIEKLSSSAANHLVPEATPIRVSKRKCKKPKKFCPDEEQENIRARNEMTPPRDVLSSEKKSLRNCDVLSPEFVNRDVEAIVTNIPGVYSLSGRNKNAEEFVIGSPVNESHRSGISFDYGSVMVKEEIDSDDCDGELQIDEAFEPHIELYVSQDEYVDVSCETDSNPMRDQGCETEFASGVDIGTQIGTPRKMTPIKQEVMVQTSDFECESQPKKKIRRRGRRWTTYRKPARPASPEQPYDDPEVNLNELKLNYIPLEPGAEDGEMLFNPNLLDADKRFTCDICLKAYKKKSHLERHLRNHTGERPYICTFCQKSFAVRSVLKQHIRIHTGEKPFGCSVCGQRFPQKSGLMTHMMLHTGKPFKCDRCDKSFVSNHKLVNHLNSHNGDRPFPCTYCGARFFTEHSLSEHMKIHNRERTFMCSFCSSSFIHEVYLKVHLEEHVKGGRMKQELHPLANEDD